MPEIFDVNVDNFLNKQTEIGYDLLVLGNPNIKVMIPRNSSNRFKTLIMSAIVCESLDLKSVDYVVKKYSNKWSFQSELSQVEVIFMKTLDFINITIKEYMQKLHSISSIDTIGLIVARASMCRLLSTFKSILILSSNKLFIESISLCRIILEQCAWAYSIHRMNSEEDIIKTKPSKCIKNFNKFYSKAGILNGWFSNRVHVSPNLFNEYIGIYENKTELFLIKKEDYAYNYNAILNVTDIFCCTTEFIFKDFLDNFNFIKNSDGKYIVDTERKFISYATELLDEIKKISGWDDIS